MKIATKFDKKMLIATVAIAASGWLAQAQEASTDNPNQPATAQATTPDTQQQLAPINRCTKLIGSRVKDSRGETLGKIDDVVVDLNTGRVSYCALKVEHARDGEGKFLAIPVAALRASPDGQCLILNADRDKVEHARGFNQNNWPTVSNPAWGAQATPVAMDQEQTIAPVTVTGEQAAPDLDIATLPVPPADPNIANKPTVSSPRDQFVTSPTGIFPTFTHTYLPGAVPARY